MSLSLNPTSWFLLVGILMLGMGMTYPLLRRLPITPAIVYLVVGIVIGPTVLGLFHFNPLEQSAILELLTETVVLISLYSAGVKMPVPISWQRWRAPVFLASISMTISVFLVAGFSFYFLGLPLGAAILLGAIMAPTDPVLATEVQTRHPGDRDYLRFTLTCEAGMNDGSAFPFVMLGLGLLGLHDLGEFGIRWALVDVIWATLAGVGIGVLAGYALGRVAHSLRSRWSNPQLLNDFLGLGLIGTVYGLSLILDAWGFLAVFFSAVALRQTELKLTGGVTETREWLHSFSDESDSQGIAQSRVSEGSLVFKEHLERVSELVLILLLGGTMFANSWSLRAVALAVFVFTVARPLSVVLGLLGARLPLRLNILVGWFGVRGIGSLFYLMYAIQHGLPKDAALEMIHLVLVVVALSILVHGVSVKPVLKKAWKRSAYDV